MPASPVPISTISRTSNVVTVVTSSAHGLVTNQGCSINGVTDTSFNSNNTVTGVTNATTYTFNQTAANTSSSGGTSAPAKEVIILDIIENNNGMINVRYVLWLTTQFPLARSGTVSQWSGVSTQEANALIAGSTIEVPLSINLPSNIPKPTLQTLLQQVFNVQQASLASITQPGQFFGGFTDGVSWSF